MIACFPKGALYWLDRRIVWRIDGQDVMGGDWWFIMKGTKRGEAARYYLLDHVPPLGEDLPQPARWVARGGGWRYAALGRFRPVRETATHVHFATIDR